MNPLLDTIVRDLAHGTPTSALPGAPVVPDRRPRATVARRALGAALHAVAHRIEPCDGHREPAGYRTA